MILEDGAPPSTLVPQEPATAGDLSSRSAAQAKHLALRSTGHGTDARHSIPPAGTYASQSAYRGQGSFGFRAGLERSRIWLMAVSMRSASAGCPSSRYTVTRAYRTSTCTACELEGGLEMHPGLLEPVSLELELAEVEPRGR